MIYYEIRARSDGSILVSTITECPVSSSFIDVPDDVVKVAGYKNIVKHVDKWTIRLIATTDEDLTKSNRTARNTAAAYASVASLIQGIQRNQDEGYKTFFHNLITTHAQLQGEVEAILPEIAFIDTQDHAGQSKIALEAIKAHPAEAADSLLGIMKRIGDLQSQIQGLKVLTLEAKPEFASHNIKKVLYRIIQPFYGQFQEKNIDIRFHIDARDAETYQVSLDYKLFNVAMHHFFNNTAKYAKKDSYVDITFHPERRELEMVMISVKIEAIEREEIFKFHVSGKHAQAFPGEGIGMYMVGKSLEIMGTKMEITTDRDFGDQILGVPYTKNHFKVRLAAA